VGSRIGLVSLVTVVLGVAAVCGPDTAGRSGSPVAPSRVDHQVSVVASAYDGTQADRFTPLWQRHLVDRVSYAKGVAAINTPAAKSARAALLADADWPDPGWLIQVE